MSDYGENITIFSHPLIMHKIAMLRDVNTTSKMFRELVSEITALMTFECFKDLPTYDVEIETPMEMCTQTMVKEKSVAIIPILRAGLGMVNGVHMLFPTAYVGHIGLYRDEETLEPHQYYCKLPAGIEEKVCVLLDPMLATGGSVVAAIDLLKKKGCNNIRLMSIIAAPEGINKVKNSHPDVKIFIAACDRELNKNGYILPGLGDAGDRLFGTK
ncbi:MAG TPA: uracil phosphoribosyltransferase [Clostridia bacterium]|nr:uracil phosphoribosyltransferase [Clostridia bacterium]